MKLSGEENDILTGKKIISIILDKINFGYKINEDVVNYYLGNENY